jgi:RHS repeat-associated protein
VLTATQSGTYSGASLSVTRSYTYDSYYRLCTSVDPETGATSYGYDAASNMVWKAIGSGAATGQCAAQSAVPASRLTTFDYDSLNRLTQQNEPAGTDSITKTYDPDGRVQTVSTPITSWSYTYDKRGLLETQALTANGGAFTISDQYDPQGHVSQRAYPDGLATPYSPDAWGEPTQIGSFATGISYNPNGRSAALTYGNGFTYSQSLDARLRPYVIQAGGSSAGTVVNLKYTYDNDNNVQTITDSVTGTQSRSLSYDALDRLTGASGVWGSASYGYDPLDNLRTQTIGTQTVNTVYNQTANRIDGVTGSLARTYTYDAQGNLRTNGVNSFLFDVANRLTQTAGVASYRYDGNGRRTISIKPGTTEYSIYDITGNLVHTYATTGCITTDFFTLDHHPIAQTSAGSTTYLHADELGSPIAATDGSGKLLWYEEYQPYGLKLNGVSEKIGFTGHVYDADTGLTDMQARLYDPLIGRFLSTDPNAFNASSPFSFNRYAYANDNPYRYRDPDGKVGIDIVFVLYDIYEIAAEGATATNVIALGLDVASTAGVGFGLGEAYRVAKGAEKIAEGAEKAAIVTRAEEGAARQAKVTEELKAEFPGAKIQNEQYLRDKTGKIAKDPVTREGRRVDHAVIQDGKAKTVETTSMNADKSAQSAKEQRIRDNGGTYIRDRDTRKLVPVEDTCELRRCE